MILPKEVLKKVKLLEINTRKLVNNQLAGEYHTAFKGQGMTFSDFREYVPGDDVRNISWSLMAKTDKVFIKQFEEERELVLILLVDISGSTDFGSGKYFKGEVLAHLAALLAFSAVKNNDRVGLVLFTDQIEHYVPPKKGRGQVLRILRDLYYHRPKSHKTNLAQAFDFLLGAQKKRSTVFVMSDFQDENYEQQLRQLSRRHDVVACVVEDAFESSPVSLGIIDLQDAETGEILTLDTSSKDFKDWHVQFRKQSVQRRNEMLKRAQVDQVSVRSDENFADALIQFMRRRSAGRG
ncbi:MAG TPA: DUF58 domain-containing protein [Pseudobdellovibrionaceae bacterium]|nr:DUF58 domain-containing protein [Pseudobdellovibrionaceae bacterium]